MEERDRGVPRLGRRDSGAAGTGGGAPGGLRGRARAVAGLGKWGRTGRAAAVAEQLWGVVCGSGSTGRGAEGNCGHRRHLKGSSTSSVVSKGSQMALVKISYVVSFSSQELGVFSRVPVSRTAAACSSPAASPLVHAAALGSPSSACANHRGRSLTPHGHPWTQRSREEKQLRTCQWKLEGAAWSPTHLSHSVWMVLRPRAGTSTLEGHPSCWPRMWELLQCQVRAHLQSCLQLWDP
ncbi:uncharacterized protein LOC120513383 isoform X4 [Passer montanus]|uniref:uncharacterized protein LOC120513383 isoform X4 n=1 Tax=Passer montanus TaxID=9160 RepID=UPI0019620835|nr:uncharacterized protein LOC120513383 isoform X4 [Passer montanus]